MTVVLDTLEDAALALADGRPCIFPTDTVYGVGVAVHAASGPDVLFAIKQRDAGKPIAWLVGSIDDLQRYGKNLPSAVCQLVQRFCIILHFRVPVFQDLQSACSSRCSRSPPSVSALR